LAKKTLLKEKSASKPFPSEPSVRGAQKCSVRGTLTKKPPQVSLSVVNSNLKSGSTSTVRKMTTFAEAASLLGGSEPSPTSSAELPNQEKRSKHREDSIGALGRFPSPDSMETEQKSRKLRQSSPGMSTPSAENTLLDNEDREHGDFQVMSKEGNCTPGNSLQSGSETESDGESSGCDSLPKNP
jgi:hypothetical protein